LRLLRPGGIVAFDNAVRPDTALNVAHRDPDTPSVGELREIVFTNEDLVPMLVPTGNGLLAAVKRAN
ncbi:MAG: methyltransferase, partial [Nocardiopsaceae bacterium]|nr:methyltransferase [Nocardiopsaceae bacterium]